MSDKQPNETNVNISGSRNILTHSKQESANGENNAKTINDLINKLNNKHK